uniref:Uncharacterized protein n=1 Tax=Candidatus Kentrum sp. FM TaxID=2126340 RepID=A0A450VRY7_9GAMM|nr:MAG: hypothetical protein BECKFM1743C_GA0114222_107152 [Candidatus Kentron sp. FM]VFJ77857.1 MAG: hypothetical protein BECKFM1743A_GA0114220_110382 [Candidatus Kentron sp. FM]VFK07518.1 MAG: hypothetical protein BECKFM1743B_GA0114221_100431 [Candidatus Kentron sp. FM]
MNPIVDTWNLIVASLNLSVEIQNLNGESWNLNVDTRSLIVEVRNRSVDTRSLIVSSTVNEWRMRSASWVAMIFVLSGVGRVRGSENLPAVAQTGIFSQPLRLLFASGVFVEGGRDVLAA